MHLVSRLLATALSPDGRLAVYSVTGYDAENDKGEADLFLVPTEGGKPQRMTNMKGK